MVIKTINELKEIGERSNKLKEEENKISLHDVH